MFTLLLGGIALATATSYPSADVGVLVASIPIAVIGSFNVENLKIPIELFKELQARYKKLYVIDILIDKDETYQFIVCRPKRDLLSALAKYKDNIDKANELIIKNMVVGGDIEALDDGIVYARLMKDIAKIIEQGQSFLSKA